MSAERSPYAIYGDTPPNDVARLDVDPFSSTFFADPYPSHAALRDAGPVVWLDRYAVAATARYEEVRHALMNWEVYSSARGVGMTDFTKHARFRLPSIILEADPPQHTRSRAALAKALSPQVMRRLHDSFAATATEMVAALAAKGSFDACAELSEAFPLRAFPDAMGMRAENRHRLLPYGDMVFNSFGPANEFFRRSEPQATEAFPWVEDEALRDNLAPSGIGAMLYQLADAGDITENEAHKLVRAILTAGVDTTVNGIGAALYCLARWPEQWKKLRANPDLARATFEEAIRFESPVQTFFRTTTQSTTLGGVELEEGRKILLFLGAANRDPRHWSDPDVFDVQRRAVGHVGFGAGIHMCVGQLLARLEGEVVLRAVAEQFATIELDGEPERRFNNTLRGLKCLPVRVTRA